MYGIPGDFPGCAGCEEGPAGGIGQHRPGGPGAFLGRAEIGNRHGCQATTTSYCHSVNRCFPRRMAPERGSQWYRPVSRQPRYRKDFGLAGPGVEGLSSSRAYVGEMVPDSGAMM